MRQADDADDGADEAEADDAKCVHAAVRADLSAQRHAERFKGVQALYLD